MTYAANNKQIAKALGLKPKRTVLGEIGQWRKQSDFPKKAARGYLVQELEEWRKRTTAGSEAMPSSLPQKVSARRELAVLDQWSKNKLRDEKLSSFERDVLVKHGLINEQLREELAMQNGHEPIQNVTTQAELSVMLARYWHGRFKGDLSEQLISDWKLGKRLRKGVPLPPAKERAYHIGGKWVEWMEQHILTDPRYRLGADNQGELDIHDRAYLATSETKILEKEIKRFEFERTQARYVTADLARNTRRGMLKLALNKVQRGHEHEDTKTRAEWLAAKLSPEDLQAWREFDLQLARARIDAIHDDFQKGIAADLETEQAKQLAIES